MGAFEWVAIIGAAAWLPQVVGWIARHMAKPKLEVIPGRAPEVGFTALGPIFNMPCAISATRKDAIVEKITARITHERGQSTKFYWIFLDETFSQVRSAGGVAEVTKNQPAVALKVSTLVLTEKKIGMQESEYEDGFRLLGNALLDRHNHLKRTDPDTYQDQTLKLKEFADLMAFARKRFVWQEGRYTVELALRIGGVKEPRIETFRFSLTANDVERLSQNLDEIERYIRDLIQPPAGATPTYRWNWAYPPFERETLPAKRKRRGLTHALIGPDTDQSGPGALP